MPSSAEILQTLRNQSYQLHPDFTRQEDLRRELRDVAADLALNLYGSRDLATHALLERRDPKIYDTPPAVEQDATISESEEDDDDECSPGNELRKGTNKKGRKYQEVWEVEVFILGEAISRVKWLVVKSPDLPLPLAINGGFSQSVQIFLNGKIKPLDSSEATDPVILLKQQEELGSRFARLIIFDPCLGLADDGAFDAVIYGHKPESTLSTIKRKVRWYDDIPTDEQGGKVDFVFQNTTGYHRIPHRSPGLGVMDLDLVVAHASVRCNVFDVKTQLKYHVWADLNEPFHSTYHLSGMVSESKTNGNGDGGDPNGGDDGGDRPNKRRRTSKNVTSGDAPRRREPDGGGAARARQRILYLTNQPRQYIENGVLRQVRLGGNAST